MENLEPALNELVGTADTKEPVPQTPEVTAPPEDQKEEQVKRTFSQEEVDALVQKRLLKEERRVHRRVEQQLREQFERKAGQVEPQREAFASDQAFQQAQIEQIAEKKAAQLLEQREQQREHAKRIETFEERAELAAERYPDFDSVARNPSLPISTGMAEYISLSEQGPDIAYHLGKNPSLAARIADMSPMAAAVELSQLARDIAAKPKARPSNAPEPITPVGNRGRASTSALPSDDDDIGTWMKKEALRERAARG